MTYQEFKAAVTTIADDMQIADYELYYTEGDSTSVEIYKDEVKGYSVEEELGICFRCIIDGKAGYASTENLTRQEAQSLVQRAYENAASIESEEVSLAHCYGLALVADGEERYDGFENKRGRLQEFDLKEIARKSVEDATSGIGAGSVPSGKYAVVFSNKTMATLLATYASVFSAEQAQKGMSLLAGKEGERIAADFVTIVDDPRYEDNPVKRTFDGEGVATYAKNVVEGGILTTLLHNLKTAAKAGGKSTGNASKPSYASVVGISPFTFYICPGEGEQHTDGDRMGDPEELFASTGEGLYVTEISGLHAGANPVTGDFSLSSRGFLIQEGKKGAPVKSFTVSGNFFTLLKEMEQLGADLDFVNGMYGSPSVLVREISVAGK